MKIFMNALSATGHLNSAIGIGQALKNRQHEVIFICEKELKNKLTNNNFRILELIPENGLKLSENPALDYAKILYSNGLICNKSSYEKTLRFADISYGTIFRVMAEHIKDYDAQLENYIRQELPDAFIFDQFFYFPCLSKFNIPWMKIISCQPACLQPKNTDLAPPFSGYSLNDDDSIAIYKKMFNDNFCISFEKCQNEINLSRNFKPNGSEYIIHMLNVISPYLNIYQYPEELDYPEIGKNCFKTFTVDAFIRNENDNNFELVPEIIPKPEERLIYFSLGSMGGVDLNLMQRLVDVMSRSPNKFIVSKGFSGDKLVLGKNMWGKDNLPQTKILPLVDLVITHGGNNTVCETFSFGKPMIVLPLFGDQYDNAQRILETGYGLRFDPYDFDDQIFLDAIQTLLNDHSLHERLQIARKRIENDQKKILLCETIEQIVESNKIGY